MAGVKVLGFTVLKSGAEKDIRALFDDYLTQLNEQKTQQIDDITEWADATLRLIYKHANNQKLLVEQQYAAQVKRWHRLSKEFINELHVYEDRDNSQQINQLVERCRELKFELSKLEDNGQTIPFKEVPIKGNFSGIDQYVDETSENRAADFDNASTSSNSQDFNNSYRRSSSCVNQSHNYTPQTSLQYPPKNTINSDYSETNNQSNRQNLPATKNEPTRKCDICFMIYPVTMKSSDRKKHLEEHRYD